MTVFRPMVWFIGILVATAPAAADITLLGKTSVPGNASDRSGLDGKFENGAPQNRLGGHGSAIAYRGRGHRYVMVADRGPSDGAVPFLCRMHFVEIAVKGDAKPELAVTLTDTVLLKDEENRSLLGISSAFDLKRPSASLRFDPEGVRVGRDGSIFISDEYGPFIYQFAPDGKRLRSIPVPEKFLIAKPDADEKQEIAANKSGRVTNKGMEGLAITPDGRKLLGALQAPLIQDGGRKGVNVRLVEIDLVSGASREFLYPLAESGLGLSEILAVNESEFLVIERDGKRGKDARIKRIVRFELAKATDVSATATLPKDVPPEGVVPVKKQLFIDLLDPRYGLAGAEFPGKVEGLAFGPDLPDGRRLLIVTTDNDLVVDQPTWIYAFAIDKDSLPRYRPQVMDAKK